MTGDEPRGHRTADVLAQDARAREARMLPESGPLSDEQIAWAREEIAKYIREQGLTYAQVAKQAGRGESTVSFWMNDKYTGDNAKLARLLFRWMRQHEQGTRSGMPTGYVSTHVAERMLAVLNAARLTSTMAAIVGPSGTSKSTVCKAAAAGIIPGCVHIELTTAHRSPGTMLQLIARRLKSRYRGSKRTADLMEGLIEHLDGSQRLIIIDEAHYATKAGCNALRDLHKQTGCPIVLVGTRDVLDTIDDFNEFAGQFKRLFSHIFNVTEELQATGRPLYEVDEIVRFAKSMNLRLTGDGAERLTDFANLLGWGGLGSVAMLLLNAKLLADGKPITERMLNRAVREMEGASGFERVKVRTGTAQRAAAVA